MVTLIQSQGHVPALTRATRGLLLKLQQVQNTSHVIVNPLLQSIELPADIEIVYFQLSNYFSDNRPIIPCNGVNLLF